MKKLILFLAVILVFTLSSFITIRQSIQRDFQNTNNTTIKFKLDRIARPHSSVLHSVKMYGFVGIQVFKVTANKTQLLKSFGDKSQYFFNTTEDKAFPYTGDVIYHMPDSPTNIREFLIPTSDWNNPNIKYEVRMWHHLKGKITGSNLDYSKYSQTYDLKKLIQNEDSFIVRKTTKSSYVILKINKN